MGWSALLQADLITLSRSWVVRIWALVLVLSFLFMLTSMLTANRIVPIPASNVLTAYLAIWLNVWSTVIIVISAGSVSLEADIVADGILSRACTRTQYILAKLAARALVIGGIYFICAGAAGYTCWRYAANDVTWWTMLTGIGIVGLALLMLVTLGVTLSVIFNNTIVSVIGLLLLWYVAGTIFAFVGAEYMSPTSLTQNLPQILKDANAPRVVSCAATKTSVSILFSKKVKQDTAEQIDNYTVESPKGTKHSPKTATYDDSTATVVLSGFDFKTGEKVTVTVQDVTDVAGNAISPAADTATSEEIKGKEGEGRGKKGKEAETAGNDGKRQETTGEKKKEAEKKSDKDEKRPRSNQWDRQSPRVIKVTATRTSASVAFSEDVDAASAEKLENYTVESPVGRTHEPKTAAYNATTKTVLLSGLSFGAGSPVKVTVKNVADLNGNKIRNSPRFNSGTFTEVQNWKYFIGFAAPTLLFAALSVVWFSRRDL